MAEVNFSYEPQARQLVLHSTAARQLFFGGSAGGGKSWAILNEAIAFSLANPGLQAYLFRRVLPELEDNHIRYLRQLPKAFGTYHETRRQFLFDNGACIHAGYAERENDIWQYRGREMHWIGVDEASQCTPLMLSVLRAWNRIGGWSPDPKYSHVFPRCVFASNPGGPAHSFLKRTFIDPSPPETVFYDPEMKDPGDPEDPGWSTIYIPAKMTDNRYLDKGYAGSFGGLPAEMRKAYIEGDWDVVVGAAFEILSRDKHQIRPFKPPAHWTHFMAMDWGTAAPFSIGWYVVAEECEIAEKDGWEAKFIPEGAIIRYREWYGWNGKENQGCRWESPKVARKIREIEESDPPMDFRIGDSAMWAQHDGISVAERFGQEDIMLRPSKKDRVAGYAEVRARLAGNPRFVETGEEDVPMFFVTSNCTHFWRTIPTLTLDEIEPDKGPDTKLEDHVYDEVVYALRNRSYVTTERDRWQEAVRASRAMSSINDPYSTG